VLSVIQPEKDKMKRSTVQKKKKSEKLTVTARTTAAMPTAVSFRWNVPIGYFMPLILFYESEWVHRGSGYTPEEMLLLARSYMSISEDPTTGKNQRASAF
jgi:hypothetical protein